MRRRKITRPEWADRLEGLRESLGMSQAALAKKLNVSAMAPSRWERGVHEPPAAVLLQLGKLAGKRGCWYFWERAGLTRRDVNSVLERPSRMHSQHKTVHVDIPAGFSSNKAEALLAVPVCDTTLPVCQVGPAELLPDSISRLVVVPRSWCPNPDETYCLRIGTDRMSPMLRKGTIFAVDPTENMADDLFGKIVFASHADCGLTVSWLQRFGRSQVLVPENKEDTPHYMNGDEWKINGRVLWWFSQGP
jgi:SOS-response transcriptional repressor LexA